MILDRYKRDILRALKYHFPDAKIYLFGSRATGKAKETSDIDLALDAGHELSFREMGRAQITLEHLNIPYKIDLVDCFSATPELKQYIERDRVLWSD
ncbi:MAG: Type I restriction-modification system, specificity subunit S [candidate division TM6 bacterium GW2011_GWE2_42_60]|nr:MAG: Type I restriction-modification system, specificity subunit S [candidate division TM6 bacterium GW2011_GWE2_42_60]HBY05653.1 nucleotidyltransferase domain-containing protein [Candidatus Dependentiae bacterium]